MKPLAIDRTTELDVNGSRQRVRVCATRPGLPPLLVVQGGPGLPILHEVAKFQRLLHLEDDFFVCYWEQRGCGAAPSKDADTGSMPQHVDDLRTVLEWLHSEARQFVTVLGISLGGTLTLQAAARERDRVKAVVVISPDTHTGESDACADAVLLNEARRDARFGKRVAKLAPPPYVAAGPFQARARLMIDIGAVENGTTFGQSLREMLVGMLRAFGPAGMVRALRNMNRVQDRLLPELVALDLLATPPRVTVPVHYVFGERDALSPASFVKELPPRVGAPGGTVTYVPNAGHHVHFDHPDIVRSIIVNA